MPRGVFTSPKGRGRAASPIRPGLFIRDHLLGCEGYEDHPSNIHRAYKKAMKDAYYPKKIHAATFPSFLRYIHAMVQLDLLEFTGREGPMIFPDQTTQPALLQIRKANSHTSVVDGVVRYYTITAYGHNNLNSQDWYNPYGELKNRSKVS